MAEPSAAVDATPVAAFIRELERRGVLLRAHEGGLQVEAPKGVIDAALAAAIRARKPGILAHLQAAGAASEIERVDRTRPLALGTVQQRMWLHQQMEPDTVLYNLPAAWRLAGPLDLAAFRAAFADVIARHEVLRIRVHPGTAEPVQSIEPPAAAELPLEDLALIPEDEREGTLHLRLGELRDGMIDLERCEPYRAALFRIARDEHVFFFMPHHVVWDGWSFDIFLRDLDETYAARLEGRAPVLPALPIQYVDYALWHREWLASGALEREVEHWMRVLAPPLPALELPTDLPRPKVFSHRGDWEEFTLPAAKIERIARLAALHHGTTFMVLLAAWIAFLHRLGGQDDIVVGAPVQARQRPEVTDLIGCFVNTLCLRQRVDFAATFAQLLDDVRDTCLAAYEHQEAPVDLLVDRLAPRHDPSRTPLFQAMFSHQQVSRRPRRLGPLAVSQVHVNPAAAPTDLMLAVMEGSHGARGVIHYSTDLFTADTVRRLRERFEILLEAALADPNTSLHELPVVTPAERLLMLGAWNATAQPLAAQRTLAGYLALARREAAAVTQGGRTMTAGTLDGQANALARALRAKGIGRGARVGICLERTPRMLVAMLGILRSGAAYVPLDPVYPAERLDYMARDAGLALVVTQAGLAPWLAATGIEALALDADLAAAAALAPDAERDARPEDPAYVIYTSGSTGKPKGVMVPHRAVVNFLESVAREPGLAAGDKLLAVTTLSFDIAVLELLLPLAVGAEVLLATTDEAMDGHALRALLETLGATAMQATPSTWRLLLEAGWKGKAGMRALVGGEGLPLDLARALLDRGVDLWNMYGPTETTVWSTCWRVKQPERGIRIGRPIANTQVHVLDAHGEICPIGAAGEIHIGGEGVALGYLDRPELTAERFVRDPFREAPGALLYRTGDRGRWLADGQLEHLGRLDFQVKVRGHRIELAEIEAVLAAHAAVAQAVVVVREDTPGDVRLAAYWVAKGGDPGVAALRDHLRRCLPAYMVPQVFVRLEAIPLLPNGKVDRRALPRPAAAAGDEGRRGTPPRTATEALLAQIWGELLGAKVSREDNFFDLGGHSLLVMQAIVRAEQKTGKRVAPNRYIFETLEQVARTYDELPAAAAAGARGLRSMLPAFLGGKPR